ncbi:MAG: BMP family ABC transporter substrate-binding protein [Eubacteriales bacterium]|nr:BMP family ABC transporter substrate-binding protein [Eubacteriales bacterium]
MKKIIALFLILAMIFTIVACKKASDVEADPTEAPADPTEAPADPTEAPADPTEAPADPTEAPVEAPAMKIALVTDVGNIDDKSFNQGTWEGVIAFAESKGMVQGEGYDYYRPSEDSTEARVETIGTAIANGANVVVCPGYLFEDAIYAVQNQYPEVQFLLLDGEPHTADYSTYETAANTHNILYQEEQAGFFAGYAAVKDGYTKLGFLGGMAVPAVVRYGYGFVQGADLAATEMGVADQVSINYWYCGGFSPSDDIVTKMAGWYTAGTEVVFACGGGIYLSAVSAASAAGKKVIGVDVDQYAESDCIITSAMKGLANSVVLALEDLWSNNGVWTADYAGLTAKLGAAENCVGLPTAETSWRLGTFTVAEYEALFAKVVAGEIAISDATDVEPTVTITVDYNA